MCFFWGVCLKKPSENYRFRIKREYGMSELERLHFKTEIGWLEVSGGNDGIHGIFFVEKPQEIITGSTLPILSACQKQLAEYFSGKRTVFNLKLAPEGTAFQHRVWRELLKIPCGVTASYRDIAVALGDKNNVRAVGNANGKNPISIVVPCHRVIGSSGKLIGYGGGLWRKEWLLRHEGSLLI